MKATPQKNRTQLSKLSKSRKLSSSQLETLLSRAQHGSNEAFRQLVILHQQTVRVYVSRYIHCAESADDIAQEVFVTAHKQLSQFRGDSELSTWLLGIARNKAKQFLRIELRRRSIREEFAKSKAQLSFDALERENDMAIEESRLTALQECLQLVPAQSNQLVQSFYFHNQSSISIAAQFEQKESTIRMKLMRIRQLLRKCITGKLKS